VKEKMGEKIRDLFAKVSPDIWLYICLGILAAGFIAVLLVTLLAGDVNKFKRAAKIVISSPSDQKAAIVAAKRMPSKVTKLYKRVKATGEKPGDVIGVDSAINVPYYTSVAPKFTLIMLLTTIFTVFLMLAGGYISTAKTTAGFSAVYADLAVVAVAGLIFTVIAFVVSALFYKGAVKKYDAYISALDALSKDGGFENVDLGEADAAVMKKPAQKGKKPDNAASVTEDAAEDIPVYTPAYEPQSEGKEQSYGGYQMQAEGFDPKAGEAFTISSPNVVTNNGPMANTVIIEEDNPAPAAQSSRPGFGRPYSGESAPVFEPVAEPSVSAPRMSVPLTTAQDLRARAEAARAERMEREKAANQAAAESKPMGVSGSADEVVKKIEKAASEGAPLSTMKEIALQLQQERAKPENKTPEMQKKLSEAQVMLIKAMSSALRK
jgi:hypothetical protein